MRKVGQPPEALFKKARTWYEAASSHQEFLDALRGVESLARNLTKEQQARMRGNFKSADQNYSVSADKLQKALSLKIKEHFKARGVAAGNIIKLNYPIYSDAETGALEPKVDAFATAIVKIKAFNFRPKDNKVPEDRFRVIAHVVNPDGKIDLTPRYFPFDKRCSFDLVPA